MPRLNRPLAVRSLVLIVLPLLSMTITPASAQSQNDSPPPSAQFSSKTGSLVLEAQNFLTEGYYQDALIKLTQALSLENLTAYERSVIYQMQGSAYYGLNRLDQSIAAFENALTTNGLSPKDMDNTQRQIAQLMIANGQHADGARRLEIYLQKSGADSGKFIEMLMQAWVQAKQYDKALPWARKWFDAAQPKERKHFDILNFLYHSLNQPEKQAEIVRTMIEKWPNDTELWDVWASLFVAAGQDQDAFEVTRLRYLAGAMTREADLLKVVQYYSYYDMPYQAAQILETELNAGRITKTEDTLEQLSSLWRQSREYARAIPVLEAATRLSLKPELDAQLGEALYNEGECSRAETAFKRAIDNGYDAAKAWMLIGTCRYEDVQKQEKLACEMSAYDMENAPISKARLATIDAFENVPTQSRQRSDAQKWVSFVKAERVTFDRQCKFQLELRIQECNKDIERAYKNQFIDGVFKLGDPSCQIFVASYDKEHRSKDAG